LKISLDELRSLPQPRQDISFNEKLVDTLAVKPVVGELTVAAGATGMRLAGRVQTLLKLTCDRCLRPYFQSITVDIDERFVIDQLQLEGKAVPRDRELIRAEDWAETLPPDNVLDISDVVYQAVTLATPNSCSCGSDCPGPPITAKSSKKASLGKAKEGRRADTPVDPRWKNLKTLFPNDD
jgi:uncharacterized metal-binding protein YceD (DUF177 family)